MNVTLDLSTVLMAAMTGMGGVILWFLRGVALDIRAAVNTIGEHTTQLAVLHTRVAALEAEQAEQRGRQHDFGEFLSSIGYKRRERKADP